MKKHENRFSVVFTPMDQQQKFVMDVLNALPRRKIAVYLTQAVIAYERDPGKIQFPPKPINTVKRKRGRPRKYPLLEQVRTEPEPVTTGVAEDSLHIEQRKLTEVQTVADSSLPPSSDTQIDDVMLGSMMNFVGDK